MVLGDGDVTFTAVFDSTVRKYAYTVEYVDGGGNAIADPLSGTADYGSTVDAEIKDIVGYTAPSKTVMVFVSEDESKNVVTYVYTIIVYTITFDDGTVQTDVKYTVKDSSVDEPPITKKKGYTGVWEEYVLDLTDKTVKAVYTAESYHVEFISDGAVFFAYGLEYGKEITLPSRTRPRMRTSVTSTPSPDGMATPTAWSSATTTSPSPPCSKEPFAYTP